MAGQGPDSHPWAWGQGHGSQGLVASRPTLAMPPRGQSTPGTLTWGEGNGRAQSVPWGYDGPQNASLPLHISPSCSHAEGGFIHHPQGCAGRRGAAAGASEAQCSGKCSPPTAFCCQPPNSPLELKGEQKSPAGGTPHTHQRPTDARGQLRAPAPLPPALSYVSPWVLWCDLPALPAPTPMLTRVFSPTHVTLHAPVAGRRDLCLPPPGDPAAPLTPCPEPLSQGKAPGRDPASLPRFLQLGRDAALQEGFLPPCPPLYSFFFPFPQHFSLSEGEGVSGFWVLNTLCFADVFPSGNCCVAPLPAAWGQPKGSRSSGWDLPLWAEGSPTRSGVGTSPSPLPGASGSPSGVSLQPMSLFPATPRFAPAGRWRAKLLSCCHAGVWPPDGDLHPQWLLSITQLPLQKCLLLSPHLLQLCLQISSFCIPAWDCPRMGT